MSKIMVKSAIGAIIGDIAGSKYEYDNMTFDIGSNHLCCNVYVTDNDCYYTDDTIMTVAVMKAMLEYNYSFERYHETIVEYQNNVTKYMRDFGRHYPSDYGDRFRQWLEDDTMVTNDSYGNGCLMRVSPVLYNNTYSTYDLAKATTIPSHNHPDSFWAVNQFIDMAQAPEYTLTQKEYRSLESLRGAPYCVTVKGTWNIVKNVLFQSSDMLSIIRNCIYIGGDVDTNCAIACSIDGYRNGVPGYLYDWAMRKIPEEFQTIIKEFDEYYVKKDEQ